MSNMWSDDNDVSLKFSLATADMNARFTLYELIGTQLQALCAESNRILDKNLPGMKARVESDNVYVLDIDTAKEMVVSYFCGIPWLKRVLLRLLNVDMESASTKQSERVGRPTCDHVALRSRGVRGAVRVYRSTPWLGCLSDLAFGSSHRPSLMGLHELTEFFTMIQQGVSLFGAQLRH